MNEITTPKASALALMASRFSCEPNKLLETLKNTVFKNATNDELLALVVVSNEYGLNPLTKEIYAFPAKGGGIVPVVSIDGWLRMMNDHPQFDGIDYEWEHDGEKLAACTAIIFRKDRSKPVRVTEYLAECKRATDPWKMEHRMLRHKATIQCARVAFGFSGITDEDEAANTPGLASIDVTPKAEESKLFKPKAEKPKPAKQEDALIDVPAVSLAEQIEAKMKADGLEWPVIDEILRRNGISILPRESPHEMPEDVLAEALACWTQVQALAKGGAK